MKRLRREFLGNTGYVCKATYRQLLARFVWKEMLRGFSKGILIFFLSLSWYRTTYSKFFLIYSKLVSKQTITTKSCVIQEHNVTTMRYLRFNHREYEVFLQTAEKEPGTHILIPWANTEAEHHFPFRRACQLLPPSPLAFQRHSVFLCMLGLAIRVSQRGHKHDMRKNASSMKLSFSR